MRSVKLLKYNYLIFWAGLSCCCVDSGVDMVSEEQKAVRLLLFSRLHWKSPTLCVCQMPLLYLCQ